MQLNLRGIPGSLPGILQMHGHPAALRMGHPCSSRKYGLTLRSLPHRIAGHGPVCLQPGLAAVLHEHAPTSSEFVGLLEMAQQHGCERPNPVLMALAEGRASEPSQLPGCPVAPSS